MKVLDVSPFHDGLRGNLAMLSRLESEMRAIETAVEGLVAMDESLKGHGGDSIRAFYKNCHLPHLQFFMTFKSSFESTLARMDSALDALESDASSGFIRQSFLEGKVEDGLTEISQLTSNLTDEANSIMDQVSDIVALPHLNDSGVQEGVQAARKKRDQTVVDLNEFDANQKMALVTIENDLVTMAKWVSDIEGLFTQGVTDINFPMDRWAALSSKNTLKTDLVHRTAETAGIAGMTDMNDQLVTSFGVDASGGDSVMKRQGFGDDGPGQLFGMGAFAAAYPGMATRANPYRDFGMSGGIISANAAGITSNKNGLEQTKKTSETDFFIDGDTTNVGEYVKVTGGAGMYKNDWTGFAGATNGENKIGGASEASLLHGKVEFDTDILDAEGTIDVLKVSADARIGGASIFGLKNVPTPLVKAQATAYKLEGKTQFDRNIPYAGNVIGGLGAGASASLGNANAYAGVDEGSIGIGAKASVLEAEVTPSIGIPFTDVNVKFTFGVSAIGVGGEAKVGKEILIDVRLLFGLKAGLSFENESE